MPSAGAGPSSRYFIVGGTTKAGTTSIFGYLSDHPEVCPASLKEPRFFLDPDYPVQGGRGGRGGLEEYRRYFEHCEDASRLRVEATPSYLHAAEAPIHIRQSLPEAKVAFVLRHPIDRLKSWYRFAIQNGMLDSEVRFAEYVSGQMERVGEDERREHLRVLKQGRYSRYVRRYRDVLGPGRVGVFFFEQLASDPAEFMAELCDFAGLRPTFYSDYEFRVHNPTRSVRSQALHRAYKWLEYRVRRKVHSRPWLRRVLRRARRIVDQLYFAFNESEEQPAVEVSAELGDQLREYYASDINLLEGLIDDVPPWPDLRPAPE